MYEDSIKFYEQTIENNEESNKLNQSLAKMDENI